MILQLEKQRLPVCLTDEIWKRMTLKNRNLGELNTVESEQKKTGLGLSQPQKD